MQLLKLNRTIKLQLTIFLKTQKLLIKLNLSQTKFSKK
jgi:hypothetical protein